MLFCNAFVFELTFLLTLVRDHYSSVVGGAQYCDERVSLVCLSACLSVREHIFRTTRLITNFYRAMLSIRGTIYGPVFVYPSVCPSQVSILSKRLNESSWFLTCELLSTRPTLC